MNAESSRSHAVFLVTVTRHDVATSVQKFAQLYLVDLAGSEKVWKTGADGDRLEEAKFINKVRVWWGGVPTWRDLTRRLGRGARLAVRSRCSLSATSSRRCRRERHTCRTATRS
jgi:hypothetical protein